MVDDWLSIDWVNSIKFFLDTIDEISDRVNGMAKHSSDIRPYGRIIWILHLQVITLRTGNTFMHRNIFKLILIFLLDCILYFIFL